MSNETNNPGEPRPTPPTGEPGASSGPGEAGAAPSAADARNAELERQIADLTDRLLRAHAEMDNIRKRGERERADTQKYAISRFAKDLLTVADNIQRAIAAVPPDAAGADPQLKSLLDGVAMTERELMSVFERNGIRRIDPKGEQFNPHFHQAVMEQQNPSLPAGSVAQVFEAGYVIEDRVLRPASVVVARGGPKPVKPAGGAEVGGESAEAGRAADDRQGDDGDDAAGGTT